MNKHKFNLKQEVEKYVSRITSDVLSNKKKKKLKQEYIDHFEDSIYHYMLGGYNEMEAFKKVCEDMGDLSQMRFLLSEIHNSKVQLFIINHILCGLRKFFKSKTFLVLTIIFCVVLLLFLFVLCPIICVLGPDTFFRGTADYISLLINRKIHIRIIMFLTPIIVLYSLFPLLSIFYTYLILFFECFWRYPSLFFITLFHRYSFKINKFKFFNSNNIYEQPNITISKNGKTYFLHLLDISKPDKKVFIVESDSEYRIYETVKIKKVI